MFGKKKYSLSLGRVYDKITVKEGNSSLDLYVDADPARMVAGLDQVQKKLKKITTGSTPEEQREAALYFAGVIFGAEQANKLLDYYHGDGQCVVVLCGKYFGERLGKMITAAQKKMK